MTSKGFDIARKFATALDNEDWSTVRSLLSHTCEYRCRGRLISGREAIVQSYRENAAWGRQHLDGIQYASQVTPRGDTSFSIMFTDKISVGRAEHIYRCTQRVELDPDCRIARITHRELPGQKAALNKFLKRYGFQRR